MPAPPGLPRQASSPTLKRKARGQPRGCRGKRPDVDSHDLPTLLDVFQFLESPDPRPYACICLASEFGDVFQACLSPGKYHGMRTCLYTYQKNSLFKMLRRELLPDLFLDPAFSPLERVGDQPCAPDHAASSGSGAIHVHPLLPYFQFSHGIGDADNPWVYERHQEPGVVVAAANVSWYGSPRGGIICEDMGTGKTCECLALCLLTKRQMACPPVPGEVIPCVGTVVSPLETDYRSAPAEQGGGGGSLLPVPSLKTLAARAALLSCAESLRVMHEDGAIPDAVWRALEPCPAYYWVSPVSDERPRRGLTSSNIEQLSFKVYISSSTLAVVPDNLVDQWVREKYKHIEDSHGLEVLKIDSSTEAIPGPTTLIKYDIVLVSVSRLSKEYTSLDSKLGELRQLCRCYSRGHEQCCCRDRWSEAACRSPLLCVHWKRLIVDEGHIMSSRNTVRVLMAAYLIAERRWICTGTPTHNLVHASLAAPGLRPADDSSDAAPQQPAERRNPVSARESSSDFLQLGLLVTKFLRMDPFARSTSAWTSTMVGPYKHGDAGARRRLRALMQSIMVRNRPETVVGEVQLPPLYERVVSLRPTRMQALTYNTIAAFFHINAILTEREGRDYFFHPDNRKHLRQLVANFFHACSWFPVSQKHIRDGISNSEAALDLCARGEKHYTPGDISLLRCSIAELKRAANDPGWLYAVLADSAAYRVSGIPQKLGNGLLALPEPKMASSTNTAIPSYLATSVQLLDIAARAKDMLITADDGLPPLHTNLDPRSFEDLQSARVHTCICSKVTYLVDCVRRYAGDEKCIVFVSSQSDAALVDDALRLARIPRLLYVNAATSQKERRHNITTFSTSTWFNVIVMDVHLAAYGIDLSAASRVWFMSPIWQPARERQAIKRAHRLGQRRPVHVETLLTEGSVEQALWARRQELAGDEGCAVPRDIEEDGKMRGVISNAGFIDGDDAAAPDLGIPVLPRAVRYPELLRHKYNMWCDGPAGDAKMPFSKTKRLVLRLHAAAATAPPPAADSGTTADTH